MLRSRALGWGLLAVAVLLLILVPFVLFEDELVRAAEALLKAPAGRLALAAGAAGFLASDVFLPVPSSLVAAGAVVALGGPLGVLTVWLGLTLGALLGYSLGKKGGRPAVERMVGAPELERAERLMERLGAAVLVVCRGVPVLAEASVLFAGAVAMPFWRFAGTTLASNAGLALAYGLLARAGAGEGLEFVLPFVLGIAVPALGLGVVKLIERSRSRSR